MDFIKVKVDGLIFPSRMFHVDHNGKLEVVQVATRALETHLDEENPFHVEIDSSIYFYVEDGEIFLPAAEVVSLLDEMRLVQELTAPSHTVYLIDADADTGFHSLSDDEIREHAYETYTLRDFEDAFNQDDIVQSNNYIRILKNE
jgi:hypothetical protein